MTIRCLCVAITLVCGSMVLAEVTMPVVFSDHMVLQRDSPVPVWGSAGPGEKVTVSFAGQRHATTADPNGKWMVVLKPLTTSTTGSTMTVQGTNELTFGDVLVGEVWLASGQSNMAGKFVSRKGRSIDSEVFKEDVTRLRFLPPNGTWRILDEKSQNQLSCVAFYFGYKLYRELNVPIGLIQRFNSGTPIQAWMPKDAAEVIGKRLGIPPDWNDAQANRNPGVQFESKLSEVVPTAIRGVIWYQGERNAKTFTGWEYRWLLPHLIETWRKLWAERAGQEVRKFPFYFVQVPTQAAEGEWPWLRDAMRRALEMTENTGMAVFYDYGPSLHPPNKQPAGERLALWALANDYGRQDVVCSGPLLDRVRVEGKRAILTFRYVDGGLRSKQGGKQLKFFELAGKDGRYHPARARIEGDTVVVESSQVQSPAYVRYLFRKPQPDPEVSLLNAAGLPASPFITDDFKPPRDGQQ